jgi:preprotein translocase subunit SecG
MILYNIIWAIHVINVILLIAVVLLQTGKGSEVGFAFGSGAAQTMLGSGGSKSFITKFTIILAVVFMGTSIFLALFQSRKANNYKGVLNSIKTEAPAVPGTTNQSQPATQPASQPASQSVPGK